MKQTITSVTSALLILVMVLMTAACAPTVDKTGLWENATYLQDKEFGNGAKTLTVKVEIENQAVTFTVHTDKETVGEALLEQNLITENEGAYGLYIKEVNGITADFDIDQSYWAFYIGDEYAMTGASSTKIEEGTVYRLVYTK